VRVLSDGDNSTTEAGAGAGPQTVGDSSGSAQVGSPSLFAPVRVLSGGTGPGDESDAADAGDLAEELLGELLGTPSGGGGEVVATPSSLAPTGGDGPGSPSAEELARLLDGPDPDQAYMFSPNGTGGTATGEVATLGVAAAGTLPYTGLGLVAVALLGLWLCSGGLALRLVPGGKRR
jgi:hypothetical protein